MIDDHAHPFLTGFAPLDLASIDLDLGAGAPAAPRRGQAAPRGGQARSRLFSELMSVRLAALLGTEPDTLAEERDAIARRDWPGYVRLLFDDASIAGMILDGGVPAPGAAGDGGRPEGGKDSGPPERAALSGCAEVAGRPMWQLARVDPLVDELVEKGASAAEIVSAVESFMDEECRRGAVGFKTILAYRTGLSVDPKATLSSAEAALRRDAGDGLPVRRRAKELRDLVTRTLLERAADLDRPVQVHTGFGDSELRLSESDPLLLEELLFSPAGRAATIILIHGSYPWHEAVAYLATVHRNVFAELSLSNLFAPLNMADRLGRVLELAPTDKVLAGSDGHGQPETHWFACSVIGEAFDELGGRFAAAGARASFVETTRAALFEENARAVYGLS